MTEVGSVSAATPQQTSECSITLSASLSKATSRATLQQLLLVPQAALSVLQLQTARSVKLASTFWTSPVTVLALQDISPKQPLKDATSVPTTATPAIPRRTVSAAMNPQISDSLTTRDARPSKDTTTTEWRQLFSVLKTAVSASLPPTVLFASQTSTSSATHVSKPVRLDTLLTLQLFDVFPVPIGVSRVTVKAV